jgi:hypothetical protein
VPANDREVGRNVWIGECMTAAVGIKPNRVKGVPILLIRLAWGRANESKA